MFREHPNSVRLHPCSISFHEWKRKLPVRFYDPICRFSIRHSFWHIQAQIGKHSSWKQTAINRPFVDNNSPALVADAVASGLHSLPCLFFSLCVLLYVRGQAQRACWPAHTQLCLCSGIPVVLLAQDWSPVAARCGGKFLWLIGATLTIFN